MAEDTGHRESPSEVVAGGVSGSESVDVDIFEHIARTLIANVGLITSPASLDDRWPGLIAQAYRHGISQWVAQSKGGVLLKLVQGDLVIVALGESDISIDTGD